MESRKSRTIGMRVGMAVASYSLMILCLFAIVWCFGCAPDDREFIEALDLLEGKGDAQTVEALKLLIPDVENPEVRSKCRYMIATYYRRAELWKEAISHYQLVLEESESAFADLAMFHIATGYKTLYDYGLAIEWYEKVLSEYTDTFSAVEARYQLGECYFTVRQYEDAIQHYTKFVEDYPEEGRVREMSYKIGCAYQELEKWPEAYVRYQGLIRQNTRDDIARSVLDKIKSLILSHPTITITRDDRMYYGLAIYYARQYSAAREELRKAMTEPDDQSARAAYFIAESYYRGKQYPTAMKEFTAVTKNYPESEYAVISEYQIALCHGKTGKEKESNALLAKFAAAHPESYLADDAGFQIGQHYKDNGKYKEAADAYKKVAADHPDADMADDALWNAGWCYVKLKDYSTSEQVLRRLADEYPDSRLAGAGRFWAGVSCERAEKWWAAVNLYEEAMRNGDWYYSDRAKKRIESLVRRGKISEETASDQYVKAKIDNSIPAWENISSSIPTRAQELIYLGIFDDAIGDLLMAVETAVALEGAYYNLSLCYERMGKYSKSPGYAQRLANLPGVKSEDGAMPGQLYRMLYPLAYRDDVFSNSEINKLDPMLVMAIMREESSYEPAAISPAGAMGLIQIMPPTGGEIAQHLKIRPFKKEMLLQPETNIRMGTWYLSGFMKRFNTRVQKILPDREESERDYIVKILASGAYNGGETRIRRWMEMYGIEDIDEFIENIPIYETGRYIKKVCHSYEMYKSIYGG